MQSPDAHINVTEARVDEFEDDGEDEQMKDMISKGLLKTNVAHIKLIDSNAIAAKCRRLIVIYMEKL